MSFSDHFIQLEVTKKAEIGYRLFKPNQYDSSEKWPLFLFLHGIKKRGKDLSLLDNYGFLKHAEQRTDFPYFILAPQCPSFTFWPVVRNEVIELLNQVISQYNIDKNQVYLTGFSMGGNGVWDYAVHASDHFAAAIPIAGWYEKEAAQSISIPVWAFHGANDDVVPVSGSTDMINAMKESGKDVLFTSYPGLKHGHEVMEITYSNPDLYDWLKKKSV